MELNVRALVKGDERFIFVFDDDSHPQLLDTFRNQAADPNSMLNWFDCEVLTEKSREQIQSVIPQRPSSVTPLPRGERGAW